MGLQTQYNGTHVGDLPLDQTPIATDMAYYDRLPATIREVVREMPVPLGSIDLFHMYLQFGEARTLREIHRARAMILLQMEQETQEVLSR